MKIVVFGSRGNMGTRYSLLLKSMGHQVVGIDAGDYFCFKTADQEYDAAIIATPTDTHLRLISELNFKGFPILCEKPISKNLEELKRYLSPDTLHCNLRMVDNWRHHPDFPQVSTTEDSSSYYNYFRHGNDGLVWDCIQMIRYAKGPVFLGQDSPFFQANMNGSVLDQRGFDLSYYHMLTYWLSGLEDKDNFDELLAAHAKCHAMETSH